MKNLLHEYPLPESPDFNIDRLTNRLEIDLLRNKYQVHALGWNG